MDFAAARVKMVDNQIRTTDVTDYAILRAFLTVPREQFVSEDRRDLAYIDVDLPVGKGRYVMEPSPFAKLLQLAAVGRDDVVLDVGCATGYSAAVLSELAASVVALEEDAELASLASERLSASGARSCSVVRGPLAQGWAEKAPFDVIVFEGAVGELPGLFFDQLRDRGRLVVVEGSGNSAMAKLYTKEDGVVSDRFAFNCSVKPLPGFEPPQRFVF